MNYYIDFDNTLYETTKLINEMLKTLSEKIALNSSNSYENIFEELRAKFNREDIYNIYKLAEFFGKIYHVEVEKLIESVENVILNGKKYVYDDSEEFLQKLKSEGHTLILFTYVSQEDISYQFSKIKGSGLLKYFDNIIITSDNEKGKFKLDCENGIFIDDNPQVLENLAQNGIKNLIRIRRENNKYSLRDVEIDGLVEIDSLK